MARSVHVKRTARHRLVLGLLRVLDACEAREFVLPRILSLTPQPPSACTECENLNPKRRQFRLRSNDKATGTRFQDTGGGRCYTLG